MTRLVLLGNCWYYLYTGCFTGMPGIVRLFYCYVYSKQYCLCMTKHGGYYCFVFSRLMVRISPREDRPFRYRFSSVLPCNSATAIQNSWQPFLSSSSEFIIDIIFSLCCVTSGKGWASLNRHVHGRPRHMTSLLSAKLSLFFEWRGLDSHVTAQHPTYGDQK